MANRTCYYPDGTPAIHDTVCQANAPQSQCCWGSDICTTGGICIAGPNSSHHSYNRGSCTDQTWNSTQCNRVCMNLDPSKSHVIRRCSDTTWCCEPANDTSHDCCTDPWTYYFDAGQNITDRTATVTTGSALPSSSHSSSGISAGTAAGIGVGAGVATAVLLLALALLLARLKTVPEAQGKTNSRTWLHGWASKGWYASNTERVHELHAADVHEAPGDTPAVHELPKSNPRWA